MAGSKEIRTKIKSVQSTRKITKAMEMVSASKMKKAQDRMRASRPYVEKLFNIVLHVAKANTEYRHPFLVPRESVKRVGAIVVTTDKGLCGGLNTNILRLVLQAHKDWKAKGIEVHYVAIGSRGLGFLQRMGGHVVASAVQLGDRPHLDRMVGPVKTLIDEYMGGSVDEVHVFYTNFVNTMKQEPRHGRIIPIPHQFRTATGEVRKADIADGIVGLHLRARRADAARRHDAPLPRGDRVPDGQREHGVGAVGADGRDEGGVRQRRQDHQRAAAHLQQDAAGGDHEGTFGNRRRRGGGLKPLNHEHETHEDAEKFETGTVAFLLCLCVLLVEEFELTISRTAP